MRQIFDPGFNDSALQSEPYAKLAIFNPVSHAIGGENLLRPYALSPTGWGSMMCVASNTATSAVISAQSVVTAA